MRPEDWGIGRLFDQMRDAVIVAEASQERIILWNRGASELFGYPVEQALETPLYALVPPDLRDRHQSAIAHYARTGEGAIIGADAPLEVDGLRSDGTGVPVALRLSPINNPPGVEGRHVLAILRDMTDRRAAEDYRQRLAVRESRRSDALELHDDVVQALATAKLAFDLGDLTKAETCLDTALAKAKAIVSSRLDDLIDQEGLAALRRSEMRSPR